MMCAGALAPPTDKNMKCLSGDSRRVLFLLCVHCMTLQHTLAQCVSGHIVVVAPVLAVSAVLACAVDWGTT
jgi:hypothetical protein